MTRPDPLGNRHPADRLKEVRDEIKRLQEIEDYIRRMMLSGKFGLVGEEWRADIAARTQSRLDRKALANAIDLSPYMRDVEFQTVKLVPVKEEEVIE